MDINKLENIQKFALRVSTKQWNSPYEDLMDVCHLPELRTRKNHLSLGLLHKIINEECILPNAPLTPYSSTYFTRSHAGSTYALPYVRTNVLHNSFFHRALSLYGMLSLLMYQLILPFPLSNINYCIFVSKLTNISGYILCTSVFTIYVSFAFWHKSFIDKNKIKITVQFM